MTFPSLVTLIGDVVTFLVGVPIVYLIARALKLRPKPIAISDPKREATIALLLFVAIIAAVAVWRTFVFKIYIPAFQLGSHFLSGSQAGQTIDSYDILAWLLVYSVMILLVALAMRRTGQKLGSIGISRKDLGKSTVLGFLMSIILIVIYTLVLPYLGMKFVGYSPTLLYGIALFTMVGFSEETVFRGYIQTRLTARFGNVRGLVVTSLLFALYHYPVSYYQISGDILGSLASALLRFFPGLLLGYIMVKSQNLVAPSVFHAFFDYAGILWH